MRLSICIASALLALTPANIASAQSTKATPAPVRTTGAISGATVEPQSTTATYGDWTLTCQRLAAEDGRRVCEVAQFIRSQAAKDPIAMVAFGYPTPSGPISLTLLLPTNIAIEQRPKAFSETSGGAALELQWRRCVPSGCFASAAVEAEPLKKWRASTEAARLEYRDASGQDLAIALSMKGFVAALDALKQSS